LSFSTGFALLLQLIGMGVGEGFESSKVLHGLVVSSSFPPKPPQMPGEGGGLEEIQEMIGEMIGVSPSSPSVDEGCVASAEVLVIMLATALQAENTRPLEVRNRESWGGKHLPDA
jgi:hypothetical protein